MCSNPRRHNSNQDYSEGLYEESIGIFVEIGVRRFQCVLSISSFLFLFDSSKQILDLKCGFFLSPVRHPSHEESSPTSMFRISDQGRPGGSQAHLSRKSMMAFHSEHSIPPLSLRHFKSSRVT